MKRVADALYSFAIALWAGGLWVVGYLAAPVLFAQLQDRTLAGNLAGAMFSAMAYVGFACSAYLILFLLVRRGTGAVGSAVFWLTLAMAGLTIAGHFGIQPIIVQLKTEAWPRQVMESAVRDRFATWHGIASGVHLLQSLLALVLVVLQDRGRR